MSKKNRNGSFGQTPFYLITMDNGRSSKTLDTWSDVAAWLDDYLNSTDIKELRGISTINIRKKYRKGPLLRIAEVDSELSSVQKRLEQLTYTRSKLEAEIEADKSKSDSTEDDESQAM